MNLIIPLCLLLSSAKRAVSIVGYDCGGSSLNVTTISLNDVGECDIPISETEDKATKIQLLQLSEFDNTETVQCKVEIDRIIYHCGMHSHSSAVHGGRQVYLHDLDERGCRRLQETGIIRLSFASEIIGLKQNDTTTRSLTLAGSLSIDGKCEGTQYSDPFGTWDNVVVQASVKISLFSYMATVNLQAGKIALQSGTQCSLPDGHCIDIHGNSVFWKTIPMDSCNFNQYDVLYEGVATKLTTNRGGANTPDVYTLNTDETTFALAKKSEYQLCGYTIIRTEHPKLFILETEKGQTFAARRKISVSNLDIFSYINSKFVYVEKHIRKQVKDLYKDVITQRCNLERKVLQNALSTATILPERFAYTIMKGPGYMAVIAGEVAHVVKCIPVEVQLRRTEECHHEIPVSYRNESFYLSTTSRMLIKSATQVDCDELLPAEYLIDGTWYRLSPHPIEVLRPQSLQPLAKPSWKYTSPGNLATSGIYSESEINKLRNRIMFPAEKPALLNAIARGSIGQHIPPGTVSMRGLLDDKTLDHIARNAADKIWNGFLQFGSASAGLIGIFIIIRLLKLVVDTCIHGYALHSIYGWSIHLLGAVWSSLTSLLITLGQKQNVVQKDVERGEPVENLPLANIAASRDTLYPNLQYGSQVRLSGVDPELSDRLFAVRQQSHGTASVLRGEM